MKAETLIDADRLRVIRKLCHLVESIPGDAIEVGVYKGGSLREIALNLPHKLVWGFDTFEGLPASKHSEGEVLSVGQFAVSMEEVESALRPEIPNFKLVKGVFPISGMGHLGLISFAHLDVDFGQSMSEALICVNGRLHKRGIIVIDDYDWKDCPAIKPMVDRFAEEHGFLVNTPVPQQCWLQKL